MTWVKVCGVTSPDAAIAAVEAGADAIGFVFYPPSPRKVSAEEAARLAEDVPVARVAVTVDARWEAVADLIATTGLDGVQPHGRHSREVAAAAQREGLLVLRPVRVEPGLDLEALPTGQIPLLDGTRLGGTGRTFEWSDIGTQSRQFVLAGGLDPMNVAAAVRLTGAWGVDASSGLESAPGIKDPSLVAAFVREAKG
jgi:phosphoribosylanthranilate isomerase